MDDQIYRPGGALYYLPLYHFFGLDPLSYRIVQISILARCPSRSPIISPDFYPLPARVAFLAVLGLCYHPVLANLVFVGAFIYDVLCGLFYLAALTYYVHLRERDVCLRPAQLLIFLLLYVLALDSKEMAVTLPVIVLTYEFLKATRWADWKAFLRWSWRCATPSLIAGAVTAIYLYGKLYGSWLRLTRLDPYRPRYSWHQFVNVQCKVSWGVILCSKCNHSKDVLDLLGGCFHLCRFAPGPHGPTYGLLGGNCPSAHWHFCFRFAAVDLFTCCCSAGQ